MRVTRLFVLGLAIIVILSLARVEDIAGPFSLTSTSPTNSFLTGSRLVYEELLNRGYRVVLGGVNHAKYYDEVLYLVIGPEKPFTPLEVELIVEQVKRGKMNVIVADELGVSNRLVERLVGARISGSIIHSGVTGFSSYLVPLECMDRGIISSKVSYIIGNTTGYEVVCTSTSVEYPIGILSNNPGSVMVLADSSIFANFLVAGYDGLPSTGDVALGLIESMMRNDDTVIVFDIEHYNESFTIDLGAIASTLASSLALLLDSVGDGIEGGGFLIILTGLLLAPLVSAFIVLKPSFARNRKDVRVEDYMWMYIEEEAAAILGASYKKRPLLDRLFSPRGRLYRALYRLTGGRDA